MISFGIGYSLLLKVVFTNTKKYDFLNRGHCKQSSLYHVIIDASVYHIHNYMSYNDDDMNGSVLINHLF